MRRFLVPIDEVTRLRKQFKTRWRVIRSKLAEACVLGLREDLN